VLERLNGVEAGSTNDAGKTGPSSGFTIGCAIPESSIRSLYAGGTNSEEGHYMRLPARTLRRFLPDMAALALACSQFETAYFKNNVHILAAGPHHLSLSG
jgi:hypothetical protein